MVIPELECLTCLCGQTACRRARTSRLKRPASFRTRAASSRRCTAAGSGRCASTPGSGRPRSPTQRYRYLLAQGVSGLSVAFDLPTQMGYDSDHPLAAGEVGRGRRGDRLDRGHGGAVRRHPARPRVDLDDHQRHGDHPAGDLRRRRAAAGRRRRGSCRARFRTTSSRSTSRAAPTSTRRAPSLRIVTDIFAYCERELPNWNTISISGYHIREAGSTAVQEVAFTLANAIAYVAGGRRRGTRRRPLRPAPVVLLQRAQRLPRGGRQVPRGAPAVGAHHARAVRRARTRAPCSCASTRRRPAARSPPSSRTTTSSAWRSRRWPRCWAARSRCTATAATRRWHCRPRRRRASPCGRSRSSPRSPAWPTRSTRWAAPGRSRR